MSVPSGWPRNHSCGAMLRTWFGPSASKALAQAQKKEKFITLFGGEKSKAK
jgi:hypothetical protein